MTGAFIHFMGGLKSLNFLFVVLSSMNSDTADVVVMGVSRDLKQHPL